MVKLSHYRDAILRQDLASFMARVFRTVNPATCYLPNWHIDLIAEYLEACRRGELQRLIINMPPRMMKSLSVSVAWPAWLLGHTPQERVLAASYARSLAIKHSLDTRLVVMAPWYQRLFPETQLVKDQNAKDKFMTTARGFRLATSTGGAITGEGGNFLIADDPLNPAQALRTTARHHCRDWFEHTFVTRLDDKQRGVIVVVMQRLHEDDLSGYLFSRELEWEGLVLPAVAETREVIDFGRIYKVRDEGELLHPAREGAAQIARARAELGSFVFAAQYQQRPVPMEGGLIHAGWLRYAPRLPIAYDRCVHSWDTAIKAGNAHDYSVCTVWGERDGLHYLRDVVRGRWEYPALQRQVVALADQWQPHAILIEDKASGQSLLQDLRRQTDLPLIALQPRGNKVMRMAAVSSFIEAGRVLLPERASWLAPYEAELLGFPNSAHDDQVDSTSQYLNWVRQRTAEGMRIRRL